MSEATAKLALELFSASLPADLIGNRPEMAEMDRRALLKMFERPEVRERWLGEATEFERQREKLARALFCISMYGSPDRTDSDELRRFWLGVTDAMRARFVLQADQILRFMRSIG